MVSVKRKSSESLPSGVGEGAVEGGETASGKSKKARPAEDAAPSSVPVSSALVFPNEIDTSKLPDGWEGIVRAELKACGLGADEEYQRQLEAYDSSDDKAGEPPTPPPTRKRMAGDMLAKHYKFSNSAAKALVKIIDTNLEKAGINKSRSIFTEEDDRLVEELVAKDLEESGKTRVRRGFWERIHKEYFAGREFTAEMLVSRRRNQLSRKNQKSRVESRSPAGSILVVAPTNDTNDDDPDVNSGDKLTDTDLEVIAELIQKDINMSKGKGVQVRSGFWAKVLQDHFTNRGLSAKQLQDHYSYKMRQMKKSKGVKNDKSSGLFTDAEDAIIRDAVAQQKQESGSNKLPHGFWSSVVKKYSMHRDAKQLSKRWYVLKNVDQSATAFNDKRKANTTHSGASTAEEDEIIIKEAAKELRDHEKLRNGLWDRVKETHSLDRTPVQLSKRLSYLKSKGKFDLSIISSSEIKSAASDLGGNPTPVVEDESTNEASISDEVPLTNDLIVLPAYQATTAKYPPRSPVTYRPSSGKSDIFGRVLEVGIYPSQDDLYVYTIVDDVGGQQHERIPERFLQQR